MPKYASICGIIPENASKRQWHGHFSYMQAFPNPDENPCHLRIKCLHF